jgi:hydroxyacylglutathione hydrolase
MRVIPIPCLTDNYAYLVIASGGQAAVVDASEAGPVREAMRREGVTLSAIWSTHHHWDHVGGNEELAGEAGVMVVGHASDRGRLPALTRGVDTGETVRVGDVAATCIHIPGHTLGALAYFVDAGSERVVFTGDTLFCGGCGRLFEGTPAQMHASLDRLGSLPLDTRVLCGHEYTEQNLRFAAHVEPANAAVARARERAAALRARGEPAIGTTIQDERAHNPFMRSGSPAIRATLGIPPDADDVTAFAAIRAAKDAFR